MQFAKKIVYVSGPYRDKRGAYYVRQKIAAAEEIAISLWQMGFAVICPHKNTELCEGPIDDEIIMAGDRLFAKRSDALVMMPNWQYSVGAKDEREVALLHNVPVFYWTDPSDRLALHRFAADEYDVVKHLERQNAVRNNPP